MVTSYDRQTELKEFDDTKSGVKGLVDAGITKIPRIFVHDQSKINSESTSDQSSIPIIDFKGIDSNESGDDPTPRITVINQVREACEKWGFFQVINHGISEATLDEIIKGVRRFHEQDNEIKKRFYSREQGVTKTKVKYNTNFDFYQSEAANWRDTMYCLMAPNPPSPEELPHVCSEIMIEYANKVATLSNTLFELLSEALGLDPSYLKDIGCSEGLLVLGHYYPACPEPHLTLGTSSHSDNSFLTVLLQDQSGGLQILSSDHQWVDVVPTPGALVVNLGDLLQVL
ncbi:1-aminocyclopropane-1-carboxylate oxidase homolog 1-like isoform X2 [Mercurialis annua]|uniref:1-aminocyclopropane-1-carboxylate oxidase homolog 1-like isoform X2 n=1 Tax=Mercurialis annua TaxID=3986 RepID=UPI0024ADBE23|nr:1-aminocyclopropane-1-carboxylate oxidase homolog 1-like isoform X2 [Mercurialis annua]